MMCEISLIPWDSFWDRYTPMKFSKNGCHVLSFGGHSLFSIGCPNPPKFGVFEVTSQKFCHFLLFRGKSANFPWNHGLTPPSNQISNKFPGTHGQTKRASWLIKHVADSTSKSNTGGSNGTRSAQKPLGGGFKYFLFLSLLGEMIQFD